METIGISVFGGVNYADEPTGLLLRSHGYERGVYVHRRDVNGRPIGMEAAKGQNFDLQRESMAKRKGSTSWKDLTAIYDATTTVDADSAAGQAVLNVAATTNFVAGRRIIIGRGTAREEEGVISSISAGVSVTLTTNLASAHTAAQADAVEQQVWLNSDVAVLGPVEIKLPATGAFARFVVSKNTIYTDQSGNWRQLNDSGGSAYSHTDATVTGASIVEADGGIQIGLNKGNKIQRYRSGTDLDAEMDNGNAYTDAGGTGRTITGVWGTGYDRLAVLDGRLVFNDGTSTIEYTAINEPYDLAGGGNFPASAAVNGMIAHVPQFGDTLAAILYIGTSGGWEFTDDLASANTVKGSPAPINHQCIVSTKNWIAFLTDRGDVYGINGNRVINLGRRFKVGDGATGPLDLINIDNSLTVAHGTYDLNSEQAAWFISTAASGNPDTTLVLDFQLGEPYLDEPQSLFEQHVRCLHWAGQDYVSVRPTQEGMIGLRSGGTMWSLKQGFSDYATTAIDTQWFGPVFDGGTALTDKGWMVFLANALNSGNWSTQVDYFLDRSESSSASYLYMQGGSGFLLGTSTLGSGVLTGDNVVPGSDDIDLVARMLQLKLSQGVAAQFCTITNLEVRFQQLVEER